MAYSNLIFFYCIVDWMWPQIVGTIYVCKAFDSLCAILSADLNATLGPVWLLGWPRTGCSQTMHWISIERFPFGGLCTLKFDHTFTSFFLTKRSVYSRLRKASLAFVLMLIQWWNGNSFHFPIHCVTIATIYMANKKCNFQFSFHFLFALALNCCTGCSAGLFFGAIVANVVAIPFNYVWQQYVRPTTAPSTTTTTKKAKNQPKQVIFSSMWQPSNEYKHDQITPMHFRDREEIFISSLNTQAHAHAHAHTRSGSMYTKRKSPPVPK